MKALDLAHILATITARIPCSTWRDVEVVVMPKRHIRALAAIEAANRRRRSQWRTNRTERRPVNRAAVGDLPYPAGENRSG
jgi:hypothetical protein